MCFSFLFLDLGILKMAQKYQKQWHLHYWHAPWGARGVKKSRRPKWRLLWWVGALRFDPNWIKFKKPSETGFLWHLLFNFEGVFHSFFDFDWILALQLTRMDFSLVVWISWHTWNLWGFINWNKFFWEFL